MRELEALQIGKTVLKFDAIEGVVVNEKKWSETHVRSSGGGAYSRNTTRHEVWIKQHGSGEETQLDLSDCEVKTREGHEVAAVAVNIGDERRYVLFVNHTAKQSFSLVNSFIKMVTPLVREERPVGLFKMLFLFGLLACFGGLLAQDITGLPINPGTGVMIFVGGLLFIMFRRRDSNNWNRVKTRTAL